MLTEKTRYNVVRKASLAISRGRPYVFSGLAGAVPEENLCNQSNSAFMSSETATSDECTFVSRPKVVIMVSSTALRIPVSCSKAVMRLRSSFIVLMQSYEKQTG